MFQDRTEGKPITQLLTGRIRNGTSAGGSQRSVTAYLLLAP